MNLIFITYINRSGSTFLLQKTSGLPDVLAVPEAEVLIRTILPNPNEKIAEPHEKVFEDILKDRKFKHWKVLNEDVEYALRAPSGFETFIEILKAYKSKEFSTAKYIVFKANSLFELYKKLSPELKQKYNIKLIALIRDPRAIFSSQKKTYIANTSKPMNNNPLTMAYEWRWFMQNVESLKNEIIAVTYEDLISDYSNKMLQLVKRLGIATELNKREGNLWKRIPEEQQYLHENILLPPLKEKLDAWKFSLKKSDIYFLEQPIANIMVDWNYTLEHPRVNSLLYLLKFSYYKIKNFIKYHWW